MLYASRTLTETEQRRPTTEKEALAILWGLQHFRQYLLHKPVIIRTDHRALQWVRSNTNPTQKLRRWALALQEYDIVGFNYVPGKAHIPADACSRIPEARAALAQHSVLAVRQPLAPLLPDLLPCPSLLLLRKAQSSDPGLEALSAFLLNGSLPDSPRLRDRVLAQANQYKLLDGILH